MTRKKLDIRVSNHSETTLGIVTQLLARPDRIQGLDVVVATFSEISTTDIREGDWVLARRNDHDNQVYNGDTGLVTRTEAGLAVEVEDARTVPLTDVFGRIGILSYHRAQGMKFRSVIAIITGAEDNRHLRTLLHGTDCLTLVGDPAAITKVVGPLGDDSLPALAELQRRAFIGSGVEMEFTWNGQPLTH